MDSKSLVSDSKTDSEPANAVDLKHTISDSKIDSKSTSVLDSKSSGNVDELCTIIFKDNIHTIIPKSMFDRVGLLKAQESKANKYDLHTVDIKDFMRLFSMLHTPTLLYRLYDKLDSIDKKLYDYLMVDQKTIGNENMFNKLMSNCIHNVLVEQKFTTDKKILDTCPLFDSYSRSKKYIAKTRNANIIQTFRQYIYDYDKHFSREVAVPNTYVILISNASKVIKGSNIPIGEYMYYKYRHQNSYFNDHVVSIQINKDNLKYTILEIVYNKNLEVTIRI
jgi:hypothetical protein